MNGYCSLPIGFSSSILNPFLGGSPFVSKLPSSSSTLLNHGQRLLQVIDYYYLLIVLLLSPFRYPETRTQVKEISKLANLGGEP